MPAPMHPDGRPPLTAAQRALAAEKANLIFTVPKLLLVLGQSDERFEDLVGACSVALTHAAQDYDPDRVKGTLSHFGAFASQRLRWKCFVELRRQKTQRRGGGVPALPLADVEDPPAAPDAPDLTEARDLLAWLRRLVTARQWEALWLYHGCGLTCYEAADRMGLSHEGVRQAVKNGLARLRKALGLDEGAAKGPARRPDCKRKRGKT